MASPQQVTVGWDEIAERFRRLSPTLERFSIPTVDEIDAFKASLIYPGLVRSPLRQQFNYGYFLSPDGEYRQKLASAITDALGAETETVEIAAQMIETKTVSVALLDSWGWLNFAAGMLTAVELSEDQTHGRFLTGMKASLKYDAVLQRYWYARWMVGHGYSRVNKAAIEDEIAELCSDIARQKLPSVRHPRGWFGKMIAPLSKFRPREGSRLKSTYTRISAAELRRMSENRLIPSTALPPLSVEHFGKEPTHL